MSDKVISRNGIIYRHKLPENNRLDVKKHYENNSWYIQRKSSIKAIVAQGRHVSTKTLAKYDITPLCILKKVYELCELDPDSSSMYLHNFLKYTQKNTAILS